MEQLYQICRITSLSKDSVKINRKRVCDGSIQIISSCVLEPGETKEFKRCLSSRPCPPGLLYVTKFEITELDSDGEPEKFNLLVFPHTITTATFSMTGKNYIITCEVTPELLPYVSGEDNVKDVVSEEVNIKYCNKCLEKLFA